MSDLISSAMEMEVRRMIRKHRGLTGLVLRATHFEHTEHPVQPSRSSTISQSNQERFDSEIRTLSKSNTASTTAMKLAVRQVLLEAGIRIDYEELQIQRSDDGVPTALLPAQFIERLNAVGIERVLLSATNDCDISLAVAATVGKLCKNVRSVERFPLGIGVDIIFRKTAEGLFSDCPPSVLKQMFTDDEITEAYNCESENFTSRVFNAIVSAKEAVFKSISEAYSISKPINLPTSEIEASCFLDVEVLQVCTGRPVIRLMNNMPEIAEKTGVQDFDVKVVMEHDFTGALALADGYPD